MMRSIVSVMGLLSLLIPNVLAVNGNRRQDSLSPVYDDYDRGDNDGVARNDGIYGGVDGGGGVGGGKRGRYLYALHRNQNINNDNNNNNNDDINNKNNYIDDDNTSNGQTTRLQALNPGLLEKMFTAEKWRRMAALVAEETADAIAQAHVAKVQPAEVETGPARAMFRRLSDYQTMQKRNIAVSLGAPYDKRDDMARYGNEPFLDPICNCWRLTGGEHMMSRRRGLSINAPLAAIAKLLEKTRKRFEKHRNKVKLLEIGRK